MEEQNDIKLNHSLFPFSFLYGIGVRIRNWLFDKKIIPSEQFPVPVICIGNIAAGGTGKTPHTEYIIAHLKDKYRIGVLSRGYKRKSKGFKLATQESDSTRIGDEPYQIKQKFPGIIVAVDEDRRHGIRKLLDLPEAERPEIILLDDGFQHRYVTPSLSIVLTDFNRLHYYDKLLPVGRLREPKRGILRADIVVVTKCIQGLKPIDFRIIEENMNLWAHQLVYFTEIKYGDLQPVFPDIADNSKSITQDSEVFLIAGIAKPTPFIKKIEEKTLKIHTYLYPDHHLFGKNDLKKLNETFTRSSEQDKIIVTTEKDAARLQTLSFLPEEWKSAMYYLPISIDFCAKNYAPFIEVIEKHIVTFKKNKIFE